MATKIQPGRARFRIGGMSVPLWLPTRAERIALDIARQKNAEFLAKQSAPLVSDSTIDSLKRIAAEDAELLAKREAETAQAAPVVPEALHTFLNAAAGEGLVIGGVDAADLYIAIFPERYAQACATPGATHGN